MTDTAVSAFPVAASVALADYVPCVVGGVTSRATFTVIRAAFMPVVLTADVSGILPAANGGTGAAALPAGGLAGLTALATGDAASVATAASASATAITAERTAVATLTNKTLTTPIMTTPRIQTRLDIDNPAGTFQYQITPAALAASRVLNLPLLTGADTFVCAAFTQTLTNKTLTAPVLTTPRVQTRLDIDNTGGTFQYQITPAALAANRILNLPLMTGTDTFVLAAFAATLTNKTISLASNTLTFTSAQLATACSDETGSGALVFGTGPTIADPIITSTSITNATAGGSINNCTLSGTSGTVRRVRFTNASGPTITGFDATGVVDGTILRVLAVGATVAITNEDAGSTAANRVTLNLGATINLGAGTFTQFEYDTTSSRWRHMAATAI